MSHGHDDTVSVPEIEPIVAESLIKAGAFLLDVREDDEWRAGHASVAHHIALGELGPRVGEIPTNATVVVCCRSGARSARAAAGLISYGIDARNLSGGMQAWNEAGLAIVDENNLPGTVI